MIVAQIPNVFCATVLARVAIPTVLAVRATWNAVHQLRVPLGSSRVWSAARLVMHDGAVHIVDVFVVAAS